MRNLNNLSNLLHGLEESDITAEQRRRMQYNLLSFIKHTSNGYIDGWVHSVICKRLQQFSQDVTDRKSPRLMIFMPPRHGKSMIASERFPVWHLGKNPDHQIMLTTYAQSLSNKFSKRARKTAIGNEMREVFQQFRLHPFMQAVEEWETAQGGVFKATGIGGPATGSGADILIIDDPIKNGEEARSFTKRQHDWEWYTETAYTRLMPGAGVLLIMTRWNPDDLAGRLLARMQEEEGDKWEVVEFEAIASQDEQFRKKGEPLHPERFNKRRLTQIKNAIGLRAWSALYLQKPYVESGQMFKRSMFKVYQTLPDRYDKIVQSWDLRFGKSVEKQSSYVVGVVLGRRGSQVFVIDQVRGKWGFVETLNQFTALSEKWPEATAKYVEKKANGEALEDMLSDSIPGIILVNPGGDKIQRAEATLPYLEAGNIFIPQEAEAKWVRDWIEELCGFPNFTHDDQVDAFTQGVNILMSEMNSQIDYAHCVYGDAIYQTYGEEQFIAENLDSSTPILFSITGEQSNEVVVTCWVAKERKMVGFKRLNSANFFMTFKDIMQFIARFEKKEFLMYDSNGMLEGFESLIANETVPYEGLALSPKNLAQLGSRLLVSLEKGELFLPNWSAMHTELGRFTNKNSQQFVGNIVKGMMLGLRLCEEFTDSNLEISVL